jgi:hypothetical protein
LPVGNEAARELRYCSEAQAGGAGGGFIAAAGGPTRAVEIEGADHNDRALLDGAQLIEAVVELADRAANDADGPAGVSASRDPSASRTS